MMLRKLSPWLLLLATSQINASGFLLYELGAPITGTAGVGQAVLADDASSSYFNPAAMSALKHNDVLVGAQLIVTDIQFKTNTTNTLNGGNGRNAGSIAPGLGLFAVYHKDPKLTYGINITAPVAGVLNYSDGWAGRYFVNKLYMLGLAINPAVSYKVNNHLSLGGGVALNYVTYNQTLAVAVGGNDGEIEAERLNAFAPQANLGAYYRVNQATQVGLAYRSPMTFNLKGTTRFLRLPTTPGIGSKLNVPQTVTMSLAHKISSKTTVLADIGWQNWKVFKSTILQVSGVGSAAIPRAWKDTWRLGGAAHYLYSDKVKLKAGLSYDSSPTNVATRLPDIPMDRQWRLAVGTDIVLQNKAKFSTSFQYADFGRAPINQVNATTGTFSGHYSRNSLYVVQMSLSMV